MGKTAKPPTEPEPAWDIALLFPPQGEWDEEDYLELETNQLVEFSDGSIEVLPMPTTTHQLIVAYLYKLLDSFVQAGGLGRVLFAPLKIRLRSGTFREPDIVFMKAEHAARMRDQYWKGADLVVEVVSDKNRPHDLVKKRREYALAGILEYWIVDPAESKIIVLVLDRGKKRKCYSTIGKFGPGSRAASRLLSGFEVDVTAVFAQRP
jgi:Uma2 family endonuclease